MKSLIGKIVALTMVACSAFAYSAAYAKTPVEENGALSVKGTHILDSHGHPVALSGVSFFWSNTDYGQERFYNADAVHSLATDWHVMVIRAAMGAEGTGSYKVDPVANRQRVTTLIDAAIKEGIYVIIDWHSYQADEDGPQLASDFFTDMAKTYGKYPNIIYEIYNEHMKVDWGTRVKPYAETVIDAIRVVDPSNLIIVGSPEWDQDVDIAAADPITGRNNIVYSLHFYAGDHKQPIRDKAMKAISLGAPLFVSEWGSVNSDGSGAPNAEEAGRWMDFIRSNCLSEAAFAVSDKAEGTSMFKTGVSSTGPWPDSDLTPSGLLVRNSLRGAKSTCTSY